MWGWSFLKILPPQYWNLFWGLASIFHENKKKIDFRVLPHPFFDFSRLIFRKVDFRFICILGYFEKSRYGLQNLKFVFEIHTAKHAFSLTNPRLFGLENIVCFLDWQKKMMHPAALWVGKTKPFWLKTARFWSFFQVFRLLA